VYLTSYPTLRSNIVPITVTIDGTCPFGTASFIPDFQFTRDLGDSQSFTFPPFIDTDANCVNEWVYTALLVVNEDDEASDVVLPWSNLVLDGLKFTLDKWDELELGDTQIRVVGSVAGVTETVSAIFTITTVESCPTL
jgi:hypothetical protein